MRGKFLIGAIGLGVAMAFAGGIAMAQGDALAERKANRKAAGAQMGMVKGLVEKKGSASDAAAPAAKLKELSLAHVKLYPAGSDKGETKALPVIWTNRAGFDAAAANEAKAIDDLAAAAGSGDIAKVGAAFGEVGKTCGACHNTFRAK